MISLRVEVHLCPAVPTEPNTTAGITRFISALSEIIIALLPPSSKIVLPNRSPTILATFFPTFVEPVAEIRITRLSARKSSPTYLELDATKFRIPSGTLLRSSTLLTMFETAIAHNITFEEGFQSTTSPQTIANIAFQAQTATGKLKAEITPTTPRGWY